jgi:hypothetical protein
MFDRNVNFGCLVVGVLAASVSLPAEAKVRKQLAKQCHAMALQAHPASLPDMSSVTNLRRDYYSLCIKRRGQMDPLMNTNK